MRTLECRLRKLEGGNNPFDRLSDADLDQAIEYLIAKVEGRTPEGEIGPAGLLVIPRHMAFELSRMPKPVLGAEIARMRQELQI